MGEGSECSASLQGDPRAPSSAWSVFVKDGDRSNGFKLKESVQIRKMMTVFTMRLVKHWHR